MCRKKVTEMWVSGNKKEKKTAQGESVEEVGKEERKIVQQNQLSF